MSGEIWKETNPEEQFPFMNKVLSDKFGSVKWPPSKLTAKRFTPLSSGKLFRGFFRFICPKSAFYSYLNLAYSLVIICVGNVGLGEMDKWVEFYDKCLGFSY